MKELKKIILYCHIIIKRKSGLFTIIATVYTVTR